MIILEGDGIKDVVIPVTTTEVIILLIPNLSYRGTLRAVSVCGRESKSVAFQGKLPFGCTQPNTATSLRVYVICIE